MAEYTNPHNGTIMKAIFVDKDALQRWHDGWLPDLIDYSKPLGVVAFNSIRPCCDNVKCWLTCKYHVLTYTLIQHEIYHDGVLIECPAQFTFTDHGSRDG
jgi:hypothetical protein